MDPKSETKQEETSAKDSELMELGQVLEETRSGPWGHTSDNGWGVRWP